MFLHIFTECMQLKFGRIGNKKAYFKIKEYFVQNHMFYLKIAQKNYNG